jgi:hypothetical protein
MVASAFVVNADALQELAHPTLGFQIEPLTVLNQVRQPPAALRHATGARISPHHMQERVFGRLHISVPRGKKRACARVLCEFVSLAVLVCGSDLASGRWYRYRAVVTSRLGPPKGGGMPSAILSSAAARSRR